MIVYKAASRIRLPASFSVSTAAVRFLGVGEGMGWWSVRTTPGLGFSTPAIDFSIPGLEFSVAGFERVSLDMAQLWRAWLKRAEGIK